MTRFDRVLSDSELIDVYRSLENPKHDRDSVIEAMGAAVEAYREKLAELEPVAWRVWLEDLQCWSYSCDYHGCGEPLYAHPMPCVSPTSDKAACVSENGESDTQRHLDYIKRYQKWRRGEDKTMSEMGLTPKQIGEALDWLIGVAENHIADASKMVGSDHIADMRKMVLEGWRLVPDQLNNEMAQALRLGSRKDYPSDLLCEVRYTALLAAAPKCTGESK